MSETILKIENLSKQYRLGLVGTGTLSDDLKRWWYLVRGKEDPFLKVGDTNNRATKGDSDYVWALQDINFEVKRGEVLGIIGKNGAGKSTLLKILSKVTGPTTGSIKSRGRIASLLEVGTGFHPELTGKENVFLNGAILGMSKGEIKAKYKEIVDFSGCERYIDTPVKRYSSGMRVRLAFAVAAFLEPDILVIDEVLAVGDAEFQKKAIGKMQDISKGEGRTVLFVSHNMAAVKNLCTKGIVLENGTVVFEGGQNEAIDNYLSIDDKINLNIKDRVDRIGNQKIKVSNIIYKNKKEKIINEIISGESLKIEIHIAKKDKVNYDKLHFALNVLDNNQNFMLTFVSDEMGFKFNDLENHNYFSLEIPHLYLRSGFYSLRVLISEFDTNPNNFIDVIENIAELHVLPGDLWKSGKINRKGNYAIIPAEYKIN